jgi:hypothetical protein
MEAKAKIYELKAKAKAKEAKDKAAKKKHQFLRRMATWHCEGPG